MMSVGKNVSRHKCQSVKEFSTKLRGTYKRQSDWSSKFNATRNLLENHRKINLTVKILNNGRSFHDISSFLLTNVDTKHLQYRVRIHDTFYNNLISFNTLYNSVSSEIYTVYNWVKCALFYMENDAEIFPVRYTRKAAEKGFKMASMMNKLVKINSCEIILEK